MQYYNSEEDFQEFHSKLKLSHCPHCKKISTLILHGKLYGYDEKSANQKIIRGRRIFCNNRKTRNNGCGKTFSILASTTLKNFSISATSLWTFLTMLLTLPTKIAAFRKLDISHSESSTYRLWKRFSQAQSKIRIRLFPRLNKPQLPTADSPVAETISHLQSAFNNHPCPIAAFQKKFQASFL